MSEAMPAPFPGGTSLPFSATFNITMLEGTEVVFIVIAFGASGAGLCCLRAWVRWRPCWWWLRWASRCIGRWRAFRRTR